MTLFASADAFAFTISGDDAAYAGTASIFSVRFTIDAPALYRLEAFGFAQNNATSYLRLSDAAFEPLIEFDAPNQVRHPRTFGQWRRGFFLRRLGRGVVGGLIF